MNITRRDTIVIATLCNILILVVVIAIANRTKPQQQEEISQVIEPLQRLEEHVPNKKNDSLRTISFAQTKAEPESPSYLFDEIDQLLEEYGTLKEEPAFSGTSNKKATPDEAALSKDKKRIATKSAPTSSTSPKPSVLPSPKQQKKSPMPLRTYTVQQGDNPWTIAKKCKISVETLLRLNHLDEVKAKNLKIGQILIIQDSQDEDDLNATSITQERFRYSK